MSRRNDLLGNKYGMWKVVGPFARSNGQSHWKCRCDCGAEKWVGATNLIRGVSQSCGCQNRAIIDGKKQCSICKNHLPLRKFYTDPSKTVSAACKDCRRVKAKLDRSAHPERYKEANLRAAAKLRADVIGALGGQCACCGERRLVFLALDHINGGGRKEAAKLGNSGVYRKARREGCPRDKYQVLCHNCNWAKHVTNGNCPHREPSWMPPPYGGSIGMGI